ncbi:MAG TPA: TIGR00270 family protein [Thermoplasmata archaeon]|jgi:putative transcription factor|nr:TIGR00270 family protein [Thermoplasmata archaeon]HIH29078.1 TIGR00270 family protein [Thermoplasmata archaeon]
MPCELCGRECKGGKEAIIDGAKMFVCPDCMKYAEGVVQQEPVRPSSPTQPQRAPLKKTLNIERDIYKDKGMQKELVTDWNHTIEHARKKKGLTREELGFRIGERTVTIAKLENGDLRPSDQTIAKLEKELGIKLLEDVKEVPTGSQKGTQAAFTLGDFIKTDK